MGVLEYTQLEEVLEEVLEGALREGLNTAYEEVDLQMRKKRTPG